MSEKRQLASPDSIMFEPMEQSDNSSGETVPQYDCVDMEQDMDSQQNMPASSSGLDYHGLTSEQRRSAINMCIDNVRHARNCTSANCGKHSCIKMKRVLLHYNYCKLAPVKFSTCKICKQLMALCCYHARTCTEELCSMPNCRSIKNKIKFLKFVNQVDQKESSVKISAVISSTQPNPLRTQRQLKLKHKKISHSQPTQSPKDVNRLTLHDISNLLVQLKDNSNPDAKRRVQEIFKAQPALLDSLIAKHRNERGDR